MYLKSFLVILAVFTFRASVWGGEGIVQQQEDLTITAQREIKPLQAQQIKPKPVQPIAMQCVGGTIVYKHHYEPGVGSVWWPWPGATVEVYGRDGKRVGRGRSRLTTGRTAVFCINIPLRLKNVDIVATGTAPDGRKFKAALKGMNLSGKFSAFNLQGYPLEEW